VGRPTTSRWGSRVDGRWWGGANAPGGWSAYRRPVRGYALPRYWVSPRFTINDWQAYGLRQPASGYNWVRYYDDAVLIDSRGSVFDSRSGLDWDRFDGGYADAGYATDGYADDRGYARERRDDGLGGAAIGAVAGGVAGNVIAGRGNRLGGTLIGAGVGAAAGYAIDKAEDRGRYDDRRGAAVAPPGAGYAPPAGYADTGYDYPPPAYPGHPASSWVSPDGRTTVTTSTAGYGGGYWGGGGTTTVVVQSAPVVTTTTTTDIIEDHVTYTRAPAGKARSWKPKTRCYCP